jgi:5-hydroxyisourate hydrolase
MSAITTHVLDVSLGRPAAGIEIRLEHDGDVIGTGTTDDDGRVGSLGPDEVEAGSYRLRFATAAYFETRDVDHFYPEVTVDFVVADATQPNLQQPNLKQHWHIPLLLSPFSYSTYRGS